MKNILKIISYQEIKKYLDFLKNKNIVLVGGCFDIFHYGHLKFLEKAKKQGDFLIVILESDQYIKKYKRQQPIHNQQQRAEILASLSFVDLIIKIPLFKSDKNYFELVKLIKPKIIAVTQGDKQLKNKKKQAREIGGEVKVVSPLLKKFSTKKIAKMFKL